MVCPEAVAPSTPDHPRLAPAGAKRASRSGSHPPVIVWQYKLTGCGLRVYGGLAGSETVNHRVL